MTSPTERWHVKRALWIACGCLAACGPATPAPATVRTPAKAQEQPAAEPDPPLVYSKFTDPLYLAFSDEQNVFGRRTLARLWVTAAESDPPSDARAARLQEARQALERAERAVAAQPDACEARVDIAMERAMATKNHIEQQYLRLMEQGAEDSPEARSLDAQVHLLRDEIEALRSLAEPCPKEMFDRSESSI